MLFSADLREGEEEHLLGRERLEPGQRSLGAELGHAELVGAEGLVHAAVVGDVLALGQLAIHLKGEKGKGEKGKREKMMRE